MIEEEFNDGSDHPFDRIDISALTFSSIYDLLQIGMNRTLDMNDLLANSPYNDAKALHRRFKQEWGSGERSLATICFSMQRNEFISWMFIYGVEMLSRIGLAFCVKWILDYIDGNDQIYKISLTKITLFHQSKDRSKCFRGELLLS